MFSSVRFFVGLVFLTCALQCQGQAKKGFANMEPRAKIAEHAAKTERAVKVTEAVVDAPAVDRPVLSKEQYKKLLPAKSYHVLFEDGTERAFTGELLENHREGLYLCKACGNVLFSSKTKFESGTGWPSFFQAFDKTAVLETEDMGFGMTRIAVNCARCKGHLGHVFNDGPKPTGLRYCMNSVALDFKEEKK